MADYDHALDIEGEALHLVKDLLISKWEMGKGAERGNEYNCSSAENMARVIASMHLGETFLEVDSEWIEFIVDVRSGLVETIYGYEDVLHPWCVQAVRDLEVLNQILSEVDQAAWEESEKAKGVPNVLLKN